MKKVKDFFRKTYLMKVYKNYKKDKEERGIMAINEEYRKCIEPLKNIYYLNQKIEELWEKANEADRIFYVIAQSNEKVGIYGYLNCFLPHIAYAVAKGYIPVIDMQNHRNIYIPENVKTGEYNSWEDFFEQPMGFGLDDLVDERVIYCPDFLWYRWMPNSCPLMGKEDIQLWSVIYKNFVRYSAKTKQYVENELKDVLECPEKTLAVRYRGSEYTKGHAIGHPIQPTMKMLADKVAEVMKKYSVEKIYVASDEKSIVDYMEKRFPGKILINKRVYYDEIEGVDFSKYNIDGTFISGSLVDRDNNEYLTGVEYISSMNIVSHCNYFVGGACGGTTAILYMNGLKFEDCYVYDLGKYGSDDIPKD